jgi:hypothetical protein
MSNKKKRQKYFLVLFHGTRDRLYRLEKPFPTLAEAKRAADSMRSGDMFQRVFVLEQSGEVTQ